MMPGRTDAERVQFLNTCAAQMTRTMALDFQPFRENDHVRNRHAWIRDREVGCGVVAYEYGEISVHVYAQTPASVASLKEVWNDIDKDGPALPPHMRQRLRWRPAPRKDGKCYLEFRWNPGATLATASPDVAIAAAFFHAVRFDL
jgi:hypothetical protein